MIRTVTKKISPALLTLLLLVSLILGNLNLFSQEIIDLDSTALTPSNSQNESDEEGFSGIVVTDKILDFSESSIVLFNQVGSFGLSNNGINIAVKTDHYRFFTGYGYQNNNSYREHNNNYSHNLDIGLEITPSSNSSLKIFGSFVEGQIKLPGSLTKVEFEQDPYLADPRSINRDEKRISTDGRVDIEYEAKFGKLLNNGIEISTYGTIDFSKSATREYRIINRYGFGLSAKYMNTTRIGSRSNDFSVGGEIYTQPERTEYYDNLGGDKSDQIDQLTSEKTINTGFYLSDNFEILRDKMFISLTGRYDNVVYKLNEETVPSRSDRRTFDAITPKLALNFNLIPLITLYTSFGLGFESPADKQLDSPDPFYLYNPDLKAEKTKTFEAGIKGNLVKKDSSLFFRKFSYKASFFKTLIDNEIVPYEVFGDVFYRNATKTNRYGLEMESRLEIYKDLTFAFSYIYSHFIYDSYSAISIETDTTGNIVQVNRDFSGRKEPNVPENNLNLSLSYKHTVGKKITISGKLSHLNISGLWVNDANTDKTNSYDLLNANIGFDMKFGHIKLAGSGGINNIFDKVYASYMTTNSANKRFYNPGAPRNYFCSLNIGYLF